MSDAEKARREADRKESDAKNLGADILKMPLIEKIVAIIALFIVVGWIYRWSYGNEPKQPWFATLSFSGALLIATFIILKLNKVRLLPPRLEKWLLPIMSLVPVLGYLIEIVKSPAQFMTVGGALALAYVSTTTYWRKHIPDFATRPLGEKEKEEEKAAEKEEEKEAKDEEEKKED